MARSPHLTPSDYLIWGFVENYFLPVQIQSLSHIIEGIEQASAAVRTKTFEKLSININYRSNHITTKNGAQGNSITQYLSFLSNFIKINIETSGRQRVLFFEELPNQSKSFCTLCEFLFH